MFSIDYSGKIVFITGGGRGIGFALTEAFAEAGATVVITYNSRDPSEHIRAVSKKFGVPIHVYYCPAEESKRIDEVIELASREVGEVDIVIANAGMSQWVEMIDMKDTDLRRMFDVNLVAPLFLARAFTRHWLGLPAAISENETAQGSRKDGVKLNKKIVFISSISGLVNMSPQYQVAYNASKAGLTMASKSLAGEWAKYGITVNSISPGYVSTDMIKNPPPGEGEQWVTKWNGMTPVGRFADPKEIGDTLVLMCSDKASTFMTGHDLVIDGGYTTY